PSAALGSFADEPVASLCFDSRKLEARCLFVAIKGGKSDGHDFLQAAADKGAIALVVEDAAKVPKNFLGSVYVAKSSREALNQLSAKFFGEPAKDMFCIGVTGTNGKTTTTYMTEAIFAEAGKPAGVIGTINHHFQDHVWKTEMTTPDPVSFQERLNQFKDLGAKAVALEVSSHALDQARVDEVPFDVAVFTNLSRDHLDYHKDMNEYFKAKSKLFSDLLTRSTKPNPTAVINADDEYAMKLVTASKVRRWTYGLSAGADLHVKILSQGFGGTRFSLKTPVGEADFQLNMVGLHNVANACGAIGAALAADIPLATCVAALAKLRGVSGRLESVPNTKGIHVFVDYAHTDDALKTVLHFLNDIRKKSGLSNRLITVFGCGGDRDKGKRPLMAKAAMEGSDLVVLTSDNPRTEDPEQILNDAMAGAPDGSLGNTLFRDADRKRGIALAINKAQAGDVVLIAGKGHEDYQQ
ncbi:MAG: UDP-N-acetylmuramoyl-L-alanyl-D-glutamate--2,6-diaminopimelate ligase, partial [Proteobacteria bacterium]